MQKDKVEQYIHRFIELIFHPLLVICYCVIIIVAEGIFPFQIVSYSLKETIIYLFTWMMFTIPMLFIFILNHIKYISSYSNFSVDDHFIVSYVVTIASAAAYFILSRSIVPFIVEIIPFMTAISCMGMEIMYKKIKINAHAVALSSILTYLIIIALAHDKNLLLPIISIILSIGVVNYSAIEQEKNSFSVLLISNAYGIIITIISLLLAIIIG